MIKTMLAAAMLFISTPAMADPDGKNRDVVFENMTGETIEYLYGSNVATDDWESDLLGDGVLPAGARSVGNMYDGTSACRFDFKAVLASGQALVIQNVDVCSVGRITFTKPRRFVV